MGETDIEARARGSSDARHSRDAKPRARQHMNRDALELVRKYIAAEAENSVNIRGETRAAILETVERGQLTPDLFLRAQSEVFSLMQTDSFQRFKQSPLFQEFLDSEPTRTPNAAAAAAPPTPAPPSPKGGARHLAHPPTSEVCARRCALPTATDGDAEHVAGRCAESCRARGGRNWFSHCAASIMKPRLDCGTSGDNRVVYHGGAGLLRAGRALWGDRLVCLLRTSRSQQSAERCMPP
jgi:hypothetical protein